MPTNAAKCRSLATLLMHDFTEATHKNKELSDLVLLPQPNVNPIQLNKHKMRLITEIAAHAAELQNHSIEFVNSCGNWPGPPPPLVVIPATMPYIFAKTHSGTNWHHVAVNTAEIAAAIAGAALLSRIRMDIVSPKPVMA